MSVMERPSAEETMAFLNQSTQKRKNKLPALPPAKAALAIVGVILVLGFLVAIAMLVFGGSDSKDGLIKVAAKQTDIARWTEQAGKDARTSELLNTSVALNAVMRSDLAITRGELTKQKVKKIDTVLAKFLNKKADESLTTAAQANRFDTEFRELMRVEIVEYRATVKKAQDSTDDARIKRLLGNFITQVETFQF